MSLRGVRKCWITDDTGFYGFPELPRFHWCTMTPPRATLLVFHTSVGRREALSETQGHGSLVVFDSWELAKAAIPALGPALIACEAQDAKRVLKDLDELCPDAARVVLCGPLLHRQREQLIDASAGGQRFETLSDGLPAHELRQHLEKMAQRRGNLRVSPIIAIRGVFSHEDREHQVDVLDMSQKGVGLRLAAQDVQDTLLPGAKVHALQIRRKGHAKLQIPQAIVRSVLSISPQEVRVGLEFDQARAVAVRAGDSKQLTDPLHVLGLLRRALRRELPCRIESESNISLRIESTSLSLESLGDRYFLRVARPLRAPFELGDVLRLWFEFDGFGYSGLSAVVREQDDALTLSIPKKLERRHRRALPRSAPASNQELFAAFVAPFTGKRHITPILDFSSEGIALFVETTDEVLPVSTRLDRLVLSFIHGSLMSVQAEIRSVTRSVRLGKAGLRVGIRLIGLDEATQVLLRDAYVRSIIPNVVTTETMRFSELWQLMKDAGQYFPDYPVEGEAPAAIEIAQTKLARARGTLGRTFVVRRDGQLEGHSSGFRIYSRTWILQHLAVAPGFHRDENLSHELSALALAYGETLADVEFLRYVWRTENRWPHRLSMAVARALSGEHLTQLRFLNYLRRGEAPPLTTRGERTVRAATPADLAWYEQHLRAAGDLVSLRADDLSAEEISLNRLQRRCEPHGLRRRRHVFVVEGPNGPTALALAELATAGLCWPELINAFRIVTPDRGAPEVASAQEALLGYCLGFYSEHGRPNAICLADDLDVGMFEAHGFGSLGRTAEFTFEKSGMRSWSTHLSAMFERIQRRGLKPTHLPSEIAA